MAVNILKFDEQQNKFFTMFELWVKYPWCNGWLFKTYEYIKLASFNVCFKFLCGILILPVVRCIFYWELNGQELLDIRAHEHFESSPANFWCNPANQSCSLSIWMFMAKKNGNPACQNAWRFWLPPQYQSVPAPSGATLSASRQTPAGLHATVNSQILQWHLLLTSSAVRKFVPAWSEL